MIKQELHVLFIVVNEDKTYSLNYWLYHRLGHSEMFMKYIIKPVLMVRRTFRIGIIGEPLAMFNLQTLSPLGADNDDEENEEEGEKQ